MLAERVENHRLGRSLHRTTPLIEALPNCSWAAVVTLAVTMLGLGPAETAAQEPRLPHLQLGAGILPGVGAQAGYVRPRGFYTVEGVLLIDGSPPFAGGEANVQVAAGLGGALRILGILRTIGSPGYVGRNFDVGLRFGPSLFFTFGEESSRRENPFSLYLEPYLRATSTFNGDRIFFAELGIQKPFLRAGVWLEL